jgi:protein TonB
MNQERDVKLIILEVLGCLDEKDKRNLKFLKENDEAFCWKDLADYQNLSALLSSTLKLENPSSRSKEMLAKYLNRIIFGKEDVSKTEKYAFDDIIVEELSLEDASIQNNIDRDSTSKSNFKSPQISGFKEVKSRTTSIKEKANQIYKQEYLKNEKQVQLKKEQYFEEEIETDEGQLVLETSDVGNREYSQPPSSLKKYIVTSIILFVVIVALAGYMFFIKTSDAEQIVTENKIEESPTPVLEEFLYDSLSTFTPVTDTIELQEVVVLDKPVENKPVVEKTKQGDESNLPKAPPKLPDPIEAELIEVGEALNKQEPEIKEQISTPPPKEVVEETEEPTYFVAVEEMPELIGGLSGIQEKIKYPEIALRARVEGKVYVKAFVDEKGNVVDAEVVKGIGAGCDEAALEAILKTKFTPGKQRGKPVKVEITIPVQFKL